MFGFPSSNKAKQSAIYNAVQSVPNADAIINPRFHEESYSVGIWYNKTTVTVKGKAISIITDASEK